MYKKYLKRIFDFFLAFFALILLSPLLLILSIIIRIKLGKPVVFKQKRPGLNEKIFTLYKFRTMTDERDGEGNLLPDELRLTKLGILLRSTSLDELPELWNILKGDMSFVGPRPLSILYLPYYLEEEKQRHSTRPGLTGLAQINGRNNSSWEERFTYDLEYVSNCSFLMDLKIIFKTAIKVLVREDVGEQGLDYNQNFNEYRAMMGRDSSVEK